MGVLKYSQIHLQQANVTYFHNKFLQVWHWDQGRLEYFQFDALRQIADYVINHNFKIADRLDLQRSTGLPFAVPPSHTPWRNYSRVLKLALLISEESEVAKPTPVATLLSTPGSVTCDEYLHFLLSAFTEPAPALTDWKPNSRFRYPLLFSIKYLLAKTAISAVPVASLDEILGAYSASSFKGDENQEKFISIVRNSSIYESIGKKSNSELRRQAKESLKVMSQISYLHIHSDNIIVSLNPADASEIFDDLTPVLGPRANERNAEIKRLAMLFRGGFLEGNKIKKTHVIIERNAGLRREFFAANKTTICDICALDTKKSYPWTDRVLDVHHLLPLCSGTRVQGNNTTFVDLVPICPTCHRAVHRYYDNWLDINNRKDFINREEAKNVYHEIKIKFAGLIYA
jgi:hypothetical protein